MDAVNLLRDLTNQDFDLTIEDEHLIVSPASRLTDDLRALIRAHKSALIRLLSDPDDQDIPPDLEPVACWQCGHWSPDRINPAGGLGRCAIRAPASRRIGSLWPRGHIVCRDWRQAA